MLNPATRLMAAVRIIVLVALTLGLNSAFAHEVRPAIVDLNLGARGYSLDILINLEASMAGIEPQHSDTDESANAPRYNALRSLEPDQLENEFEGFKPIFLEGLRVENEKGDRIDHEVTALDIGPVDDVGLARDSRITVQPVAGTSASAVSWSWDKRFGANIVRVNEADVDPAEDAYSAFLQGGERSKLIPLSGEIRMRGTEVVWNYLVVGFTHILPKGLDHILFVVGLFLLSPALRPLLIQITSFTVAHTVTLALGSLGIVNISPSIVEPLIAASIVYVAIENVLSPKLHAWRPLIVFGFGLLHGLGFAGVLSDVGIARDFFVTALISFNVGVEFGQLAVIAICLGLFGWFRNSPRYRQLITIPLSLVIAGVGGFWFLQRVLG